VFEYGDKQRRLCVQIYTGESAEIDFIGVSVPAALSKSSGELALLLSFQIAAHLGWQVFDAQLGDYLDKSTVTEVLHSQKRLGKTEKEVLARRAVGEASFGERFGQNFTGYSRMGIISSIVLAAVIAGFVVIHFGLLEQRMIWIGFAAWVSIATLRALALTIWQER